MHLRFIRIALFHLTLLMPALYAQRVLTPSPQQTGSDAGIDIGTYNIVNSFETGYRFTTVGGDQNLFRSVENYGNGLRLFGSRFAAHSKDGKGRLFDSFLLNASGLGNDPYGMATLKIEKNNIYRYDLTWRRNEYFNPSTNNGESATLKNTRRTIQDHDLTISAASWAKLLLGYSRNHEAGPEFTAYETYIGGLARSVLPLDRHVRRDYNEYRAGTELTFLGFHLTVGYRREYFKDDSSIANLIPGQPYAADFLRNQPFNSTLEVTYPVAATSYMRSQPMHAQTRGWHAYLSREQQWWAFHTEVNYNKGDSTSLYYENQSGASQAAATAVPTGDGRFLTGSNSGFGPATTAFTYMPGTARHPFLAGDASFSVFPLRNVTVTNTTSVQSNRYEGTGNELRVLSNGAATINRYWTFQIGTGRVSNALDLNYKVNKWLGVKAEYRYTSRYIDNNLIRTGTTNGRDINSIRNHLNTGTLGLRLKPVRPVSVTIDTTIGRDNGPENPTSPARFHNIRARADYRAKKFNAGLSYRQIYNLNDPLSVFSASTGQLAVGAPLDYFASHSRDISAHTSFEANRYLSLDLSYTKAHLDTMANLWAELAPPGSTTITTVSTRGYLSQYISNLHTVSLLAHVKFKAGTLYAGYNLSRDTGDGRGAQNLGLASLPASYTAAWTTFPLTYQAPLARISIKASPNLQWNAGWEFYRYHQQFAYYGYQPYYRAHTGYTSFTYTFGSVTNPPESTPKSKETNH